tara:strand:+ start:558 stop:1517 length:960 start_codon:yes stop_codon:yes gene_type:complete
MEANGKVFASQDHASSTYVRNPDLWCGDLDITCVSPWNSSGGHKKAGTLVTPRHIIGAAHYEYSVGTVVRFVEKNGTVHDRTVTGKARHPECRNYTPDLTIYTLDSDLPSTIKPCSVMPSNYSDYLDNFSKIACLGLDQEEKALIIDWRSGGRMQTPTDFKRRIFHESKIKGDSGNPAFLVFDGKPLLVTVWTWGGAGGGTPVAEYISDINAMIVTADTRAGVSTNYTLTEEDFSTHGRKAFDAKKLMARFVAALRKLRPRWFKKNPETSAETSSEYSIKLVLQLETDPETSAETSSEYSSSESSSEPPWETSAETSAE